MLPMSFTFGPYVEACYRRSLKYRAIALAVAAGSALLFGALYVVWLVAGVQVLPAPTMLISALSLAVVAVALALDIAASRSEHRRGD